MDLVAALVILSVHVFGCWGCPARCRCYSTTVECGSLGLTRVPADIPSSTQTIFLQDNNIGHVRRLDFFSLPKLQNLYIQNNSLVTIEAGALSSQHFLVELALNGNRLRQLNSSIFEGLEHLRVLYLAGNHITQLADYTFYGLQRLHELHLQENRLQFLEEQALAGLSSLALLDLSNNHLRTLSQAVIRPLRSLQVLRLTDNPWRCDCALFWLRRWIDEQSHRNRNRRRRRQLLLLLLGKKQIVCGEPPRLARQSLLDVPRNSLVCIPPAVRLERAELAVPAGGDVRVTCLASGYPRPVVTWRLAPAVRASALSSSVSSSSGTGSGVLFLSNVSVTQAGAYECEAANAGGRAARAFLLRVHRRPGASSGPPGQAGLEAPPDFSLDFGALSGATQTGIAIGISLLALIALLLMAVIWRQQQQRRWRRRERGRGGQGRERPGPGDKAQHQAPQHYQNFPSYHDYSDGPNTFAQLEELRDATGREMFVIDRQRRDFFTYKDSARAQAQPRPRPGPQAAQAQEAAGHPEQPELSDPLGEEQQQQQQQRGVAFKQDVAYEIHC
uniref:Leucine rich repeat containing 24 n=1 Tax=Callorhinchus milii TaxID=7868 RepID=A0A4W3GQX3_CALMI